uniref:Uncharacterized protein n=1 Tax=Anguilla anguilla TaxID=7936 RepID=A0A0E9RST3_ANGAN
MFVLCSDPHKTYVKSMFVIIRRRVAC